METMRIGLPLSFAAERSRSPPVSSCAFTRVQEVVAGWGSER